MLATVSREQALQRRQQYVTPGGALTFVSTYLGTNKMEMLALGRSPEQIAQLDSTIDQLDNEYEDVTRSLNLAKAEADSLNAQISGNSASLGPLQSQVTAAETRDGPVAAIAGQRHAVAEQQATRDRGPGQPADREVIGRVVHEPAGLHQAEGADHRRADRDAPQPEPYGRAAIERILDRAERAKPAEARGKAQKQAAERTDDNARGAS